MTACTLCDLPIDGEPVVGPRTDGRFCCSGCYQVHARADSTAPDPGRSAPSDGGAAPETDGETAYFAVDGMHCGTCEAFLEAVATDLEGVHGASASYATEILRIRYDDEIDPATLPDALSGYGYRVRSADGESEAGFVHSLAFDRRRTVVALVAMMPVLAFYALFIYPTYLGVYPRSFLYGPDVTTMVFGALVLWSALVVAGIGYPFFRGAIVSLRVGQPNMDLLVSMAVLAAYGYSLIALFVLGTRTVYFDVAVMILGVVTVGDHVEKTIKRRALVDRSRLADDRPADARLVGEDATRTVAPGDCTPGDRLLVKPGERIPLDGEVVDGTATVDESLVTGESIPRPKSAGDAVVGGSIPTDSALVVAVGPGAANTYDRLLERSWDHQSEQAGIQRYVDRFAVLFVPFVVAVATVTTVGWFLLGTPTSVALLLGVAVLVVSCPCSLGIATPLAIAAGSRAATDAGAVVLDSSLLERAPGSDVVAFDKTGTLTSGSMTVAGVEADSPDRVLGRAAAVEHGSTHPIGEAIREAVDGPVPTASEFDGGARHVAGTVDGTRVSVGHPGAFTTDGWTRPPTVEAAIERAEKADEIPVLVGWNGRVRGVVRVRDRPRAEWPAAIEAVATDGRRVVVLTGDDERMARTFGEHPAVDAVYAGVRPEAKAEIVERLRREGTVTMVGDGTNDAAALAAADVGIALAHGTDVTIDAADAVVASDDLRTVPTLFDLATATRSRVRQNLGWAVAYNAVAIPLAVVGIVNPLIAALLMGTSSLVVVLNTRRPLR